MFEYIYIALDNIDGVDYDNETIQTLSKKVQTETDAIAEAERTAIPSEEELPEVGDFLEVIEGTDICLFSLHLISS